MTVTFLEPGGDATQDFSLWSTAPNGPTIATDILNGPHQHSIKLATNGAVGVAAGTLSDTGTRISFYFYISALPFVNSSIFRIFNSVGNDTIGFGINSSGALIIYDTVASAVLGTGPTLSVNTWYRLSLAYTITSTTVNRFEAFINGVSAISVTNGTLTTIGTSKGTFQTITSNVNGQRLSDIYIDNSNALTDPGNILVTSKRPVSNGTTNNFTTQIGAGGSGYGTGHSSQVNERPLSQTNGWSMVGAGSAVTEEYTIEGRSVGDVDISSGTGATIKDYLGWVFASSLSNETGSIIVGGSSANISLTSTPTAFMLGKGSATYPAGGTDIGIITSATLTTVSLYECGILVAYIPPTITTQNITGVGNMKANTLQTITGQSRITIGASTFKTAFNVPIRPRMFSPGISR